MVRSAPKERSVAAVVGFIHSSFFDSGCLKCRKFFSGKAAWHMPGFAPGSLAASIFFS